MKIQDVFAKLDFSLKEIMKIIDNTAKGIAIIVDDNERLIGTITDGDIRRALLNGISLEEKAKKITNTNCVFVHENYSDTFIKNIFISKKIMQIPVVDENMKVVDILFFNDLHNNAKEKENYALIMAGGLGTRLRPLTEEIPKPMLRVGDRPILETIIIQLRDFGYKNILISVNYKSHIIEDYFQDGQNFGVKIKYIYEPKRMGTAGAIKLAQQYLDKHFFVINGDILTKLNFEKLMNYHIENENCITIASRKYDINVPYGVLQLEDDKVVKLTEKPTINNFVSGGIYCLDPIVIDYIPDFEYYDITTLIEKIIRENKCIGSFPITEYWMDIGYIEDYNRANEDYFKIFKR
ncbi:nucleotidyltransferase family protein [Tepidibacter thalassicus]|uniref:CBS domain-containing protein n=1 Tax=Tepidibacter thalassicus DSM 15285 TaxID=1123350 RepID=A0A1M5R1Y1_9FIRM|nr:nucleotidyltransferase family protein [Tepidibacter thalassicus]SHH20407.1 CBS domain-containing protein [Tepidibacter thalassicus DSM 15285]